MENKSGSDPSVKAIQNVPFPKFSKDEMEVMQKYFTYNQKHYTEINKKLTADLSKHPIWGGLLKMMTPEQWEKEKERMES